MDVESMLMDLGMHWRREAVKSLLAGNDTGCFTVAQYAEAYDRISNEERVSAGAPRSNIALTWTYDVVRNHLKSTGLVVEMNREQGIWMDKNQKPTFATHEWCE